MGILSWIVLGLIAGWIARVLMPVTGGIIKTMVLGVVGAVVGGYLSTMLGFGSVTGFNLVSVIIAVLGAILVIFIYRLIQR
ncbi:putative membrane protein YeaQ/YmgE (transglycosylase-associated protein family) [Orbus hercynius]|uniref:Putative membrane protein YeaQ/YmgE (Transglycosylase-associated protein family) n=1 Tax=Orbus hercynius TaxID=593135 RepID=A0A495RCR2_9GAMM|nr:GlsB/YeaQ/YmgE family stress response membrane protein [Orbus hercynius]RKS85149.1 putative membrane protein YeaQ/YmgE (transglycosylase-associated protein family) [Orbus hercynius]